MHLPWPGSRLSLSILLLAGVVVAGCGGQGSSPAPQSSPPSRNKKSAPGRRVTSDGSAQRAENESSPVVSQPASPPPVKPVEPVADEVAQVTPSRSALPVRIPGLHEALHAVVLDEERIKAHGIRKLSGKHLTLYSDLPPRPEIEELPDIFDAAISQWAAYFQVPVAATSEWHIVGRLMKDKTRFQKAGLLPESLPPFGHGFNYGDHLWVYDQETDYYRRHLLLHEGTHGFMQKFLGGSGPAWYREGMAELLATHRWTNGKLQMKYSPRDRKETPGWGRIKIIKDEVAAGRGVMLSKVLRFPPTAHRQVQPYAWCWAATTFFENHPRYQQRFRQLKTEAAEVGDLFSDRFYQRLEDDWPAVRDQWQWFVLNMEYGFDVKREAIDPRPVTPLGDKVVEIEIQSDRGWQSTGLELAAGSQVEIVASGRYQLAADPEPWWCEANGITIHYYRGRPLGALMAAVNGPNTTGLTRLAGLQVIGAAGSVTTAQGGVLFLRINESGAGLSDNKGTCRVSIKRTDGS